MARLEELTRGAQVRGLRPDGPVEVVGVNWYGTSAIELTFKDVQGRPGNQLLYRTDEPRLEIMASGPAWSFDADGHLFRLVSEAYRIRLAYLFDPLLAVHTSLVEPLPHQIVAVYAEMLPRQPLRFLLADDPGAGKTIMAGLLIKELLARGDLKRALIICPGSLGEQWQDELHQKFQLPFDILTNDGLEAARTGNWFDEHDLVIARLDKLSRNEDVQAKLEASRDWDLVVVDEAHKMSASFFSGEVKETKRYKLGKLAGRITRHFLLMTATPHNGKEEDFQLFLALLDGDRFEGRFRDGVHTIDPSDMMRRLVKEDMLRFDGTRLFPERRAYSPSYKLSAAEARLYKDVTEYVREEFNRADNLEEGRKGTVGFALTILQRRLASSPEAIHQSLRRRRERLEKRLTEEELLARGQLVPRLAPTLDVDDIDDLEDAPGEEVEQVEEQVVDQATAARSLAELRAEIQILRGLEEQARRLRSSGQDCKWEELRSILQDREGGLMFDPHGHRRKLVIFTEHRDTLSYLVERVGGLIGKPEAVVAIHGGMGREDRRGVQERFTQDKEVEVLIATDAAGEGINLQRAHLMVNYDLPWNPNRLEQRFGRIHRIGQTEVCHLWNLVADETREGEVWKRLLDKLEEERRALGGGVFDILGQIFRDQPLRDLLVEAIRYGDDPAVRARLNEVVDNLVDRDRCRDLLEDRALARDTMDAADVRRIREEMERAEARRLQPHFIAGFFLEAFKLLGGRCHQREERRYEVTQVPSVVRQRDRQIGHGNPVLDRYERITFEKKLIAVPGQPLASFVCPGHPLLDATIDIALERYRELFKRGAVLVDPADPGTEPRVLYYLEHAVTDGRLLPTGERRVASRQVHFIETTRGGEIRTAGWAPYLDYRPLEEKEQGQGTVASLLGESWLQDGLEARAIGHAVTHLVPQHLEDVRKRRNEIVDKTKTAVHERLTKEINYWDHRAADLRAQEQAGRSPRLNSVKARQRADELQERLRKRLADLDLEREVSAQPPVVVGAALIVPAGLLQPPDVPAAAVDAEAVETARIEKLAMDAVVAHERSLGFDPRDVSADRRGYDIESRDSSSGHLRFIEVKGRHKDARTICVTRNEILTALNKPEAFILAIVLVDGQSVATPMYLETPFRKEPDFGVTSVNYAITDLTGRIGGSRPDA